MISKSVALGVTVAAACAVPAFALGPTHVEAEGFYCAGPINAFFADGGFTRWVNISYAPYHQFNFAGDDDHWSEVGLRLDAANTKAGTVKFHYNTYNANDPHLGVMFTLPSAGFSGGYRLNFIGDNDWSDFGLTFNNYNFNFTPASNTFFTFPKGVKYQNLWIYDVTWYDHAYGIESIRNVTINGVAVAPDTHNSTLYDCTPGTLIKIRRGSD